MPLDKSKLVKGVRKVGVNTVTETAGVLGLCDKVRGDKMYSLCENLLSS